MNPGDFLEYTTNLAMRLESMKRKAVFVGLPNEKVGGKVYGDGMSIIRIGAIHEFGAGATPQRSFLRVPFAIKRKEMNAAIAKQFTAVVQGQKIDVALGRIGVVATNISKGAFTAMGYGDWKAIQEATARRKGSTQTLIDTGILRSSITWVIRKA